LSCPLKVLQLELLLAYLQVGILTARRAAMALAALSGDEQRIIFVQLCNVLEPRVAVNLSSASHELRVSTQALRQQLKADYEAATALCLQVGMRSCKALREAKRVSWHRKGPLSAADLALLGTLGSVLPALERLYLSESSASPDGVQRLAERLVAGALPAVTTLMIVKIRVGDAGASALAAALGRGALPRLKTLHLSNVSIGDAGLVALAPALRRRPALEELSLAYNNLIGDEGLAALVAPPPPAGVPPPPSEGLTKLKALGLMGTQVNDTGCVALTAALNSGALPALERLYLRGIPASAAVKAAVHDAFDKLQHGRRHGDLEESGSGDEGMCRALREVHHSS
jgi:hypothetical protein